MDWITQISNNDNVIKNIVFMDVWEPEITLLEILADSVELN